MAELPALVKDLALILIVAGGVTLLFKRLRQPLVLGYIVAGFLVSPHMPYIMSVIDKADVQMWADIGVIFLLFSLGLEFSFKKILKMGMAPVIAAVTIIICMMCAGTLAGHLFGWARMDCIFLGGMLAMSSTTIIYKAFDDLGLRQQKFAGLVMSVLILEDIMAIVMMVMLSAFATGSSPDGGKMFMSIVKIVFFLTVWLVAGIFFIPMFLRRTRKLMNDETMTVVSLGLCCAMAYISTLVGFSSAFGAFIMGSILAETIEADKISHLVEPVKNLFGAIFFVSVGMLVDPKILVEYALPIVAIVATILLGQSVFGSLGFLLSGQTLRNSIRCGFSMAQIGEFAFIIASLGLSLHVISDFLYPVVVAVSVITTFLTPYMIKAADPVYNRLEKRLSIRWRRRLGHLSLVTSSSASETGNWKLLIRKMLATATIYSMLSAAAIVLMFTFFLPFVRHILPHWWANGVCGLVTVLVISPFLRSMVMKHNHSREFRALWTGNRINRLPLVFTVVVRVVLASAFLFYICNYLARFANAFVITLALAVITLFVMSRKLKSSSIQLERAFVRNLRSREIEAQVHGRQRPLFEGRLLDRDLHIAEFPIPQNSLFAGKSLRELQLGTRFGVHVSSILRGYRRINIPGGSTILFPQDTLQVIGSDEQLRTFAAELKNGLEEEDPDIEKRAMNLHRMVIHNGCSLIGKTLGESGIREKYDCMVVGVEEGQQNLTMINPARTFVQGDVVWIVGEKESVDRLLKT